MSAADEELIAELAASLRQALAYIEADAGITDPNLTVSVVRVRHLGTEMDMSFDGDEANRLLKAAAARLATIQPARPVLPVPLSLRDADKVVAGMADLLCWARGFIAARPDDMESHPMGVEQTRRARLALMDAVANVRGQPAEELPF